MDIIAGLSGIKTAADLTKMLRDGLKGGTIKADEVTGRIGEIYDYILDSKAALLEAKEEAESLQAQIKELKDARELTDSLEHDGKVYWKSKGDKWEGPFCAKCWDQNRKLVRLDHQNTTRDGELSFWCSVDRLTFTTRKRTMVLPEPPRMDPGGGW
jgi:hypothetical protein